MIKKVVNNMSTFGIDVSHWQGDFDFARAKSNEGVEFAIIKAGGSDAGLYKDSRFEDNYRKCVECELPKGAYYFGRDMTVDAAKESAQHFISILKGKQFEYPVYYDVEADMITKLDKATLTDIVIAFCDEVEKEGYYIGVYSSASFFNSEMDDKRLSRFCHWAAAWSAKPTLTSGNPIQMWQFGGSRNCIRSTKINGQTVDQNFCYVDYPTIIKRVGLNGYKASASTPKPAAGIKAGTAYSLKNVQVYNSESGGEIGKRTGIYRTWDSVIKNGRIRMTNSASRVGVPGQVSFWVDVKKLK